MIEIPLRWRNGNVRAIALIDDEDSAFAEYRWHLQVTKTNTIGYVARNIPLLPKGQRTRTAKHKHRTSLLHRELFGLPWFDPREIDHINGNTLDNRRSNLRITTHAQNGQNKPSLGGSSRFRGVSWSSAVRKWKVQVRFRDELHYFGVYEDEEVAAQVARDARAQLFSHANEERSIYGA